MSKAQPRLPASKAYTWVKCPGWARMVAGLPRTDTFEADEGTCAHKLAERVLREDIDPESMIGTELIKGISVTAEMVRHVDSYAGYVSGHLISARAHGIEERFEFSAHTGCVVDSWVWDGSVLTVVDLKYGFGPVEAFRNHQLIIGAECVRRKLGVAPKCYKLVIFQPRIGNVDVWEPSTIAATVEELATSTEIAASPEPHTLSGGHCLYCDARHMCPAARGAALRGLDLAHQSIPVEMTPNQVSAEYDLMLEAERAIKARRSGLEAHLEGLLRSGQQVPGWMLKPSRGNLAWSIPESEVLRIADHLGIELRKPVELITPTQAEALKFPVEGITERPGRGYKLTKDKASSIFSKEIS